jgi:hypothetical protein
MKSLRLSLAALAMAVAGISAGAAEATPINVVPNKLILKLCQPGFQTHSQYLGIRKIGFRFYRVYRVTVLHVHANCFKHVVRVHYRYVPLPFFFKKAAPGA